MANQGPSEEQLIERALELAEQGRGQTQPNPVVGALVVKDGEVVGEGWHERAGGPHAEIVALNQAGERARGATMVVTLEPCCFTGLTGPCCERIIEDRIARVVVATEDPNPRVSGRGVARLREAGLTVELVEGELALRARRQNEAWRTWIAAGRPFVTYKVASTLDGRVTLPGARWLSGEASRRLVHELRASSDAVAVGMGTVLADSPRLDVRDVGAPRQPRRLAFGKGPLPEGSKLELRSGPLAEELAALAQEGVQSLLFEGGPTLATAFVNADLVDKLLVFVTPHLAGAGPKLFGELTHSLRLSGVSTERIGEDVLISAYIHEP
ncbi:MAG TPA: bifunctional diaminohydroxyphosphoribosylaminopyrimidine deaminase/5-amino-6-(5-phosphoribosylamino)uracil reductase RibD [Gaiellaceae bacterium]